MTLDDFGLASGIRMGGEPVEQAIELPLGTSMTAGARRRDVNVITLGHGRVFLPKKRNEVPRPRGGFCGGKSSSAPGPT